MKRYRIEAAVVLMSLTVLAGRARAHCDGLDGPVVTAARQALDSGDPSRVLIWVKATDEEQIRAAFQQASAVRKLGPEARKLADTWFFETLVRVHRAGEGAPYTGLKPAGRDLGPAIPAADQALEKGDVKPLQKLLAEAVGSGVRERFEKAASLKKFDKRDLAKGRSYVEAYVTFIHYVERLHQAATSAPEGHPKEAEAAATGHAAEHDASR